MIIKKITWVSLLVIIILSACSMNTQLPTTEEAPSSIEDVLPPEIVVAIQNQVSETLGVSVDQIEIETVEQRDWSDSCLGLGGANESCAQVVTPGWLVAFRIEGQEYRFRVDEAGTTIRQEP